MRQQTLAAQTGFEKYGRKSKRERPVTSRADRIFNKLLLVQIQT